MGSAVDVETAAEAVGDTLVYSSKPNPAFLATDEWQPDLVRDELRGQPEVQATLMQAIGNVYRNLGLYDLAEPLLHEALNERRRVLGNDHPAVAQSLNNLGVVLRQRGDYEGAEPLFNEALEMRRRLFAALAENSDLVRYR